MKRFNASLQFKVVFGVAVLVLVVLASIIYLNTVSQQTQMKEQFQTSTKILAETVYNSMLYPMAIGNSKLIREQLAEFSSNRNVHVYIFGHDKQITYSSEPNKAELDLLKQANSPELTTAVNRMLASGGNESTIELQKDGVHYMSVLWPLNNDKRCHHCHGESRAVLGGVLVEQNSESMFTGLESMRNKSALVGFAGSFVILLALVFMISQLVSRPIRHVITGLNEMALSVSDTSGEVASISKQIANGTANQAAAIEETSSSLEEMSAMTKQNADNAVEADRLMRQVEETTHRARESMGRISESMDEISSASEETQKIIKSIDEIAFQTNLLALNAAVEAARAGEAGAGFAVVADEVRNLALRAAEAAKNTTVLIGSNVKTIQNGALLTRGMSAEFAEVLSSITKMCNLVSDISAASRDQAQGIEQINTAVGEVDKVIQESAINAEQAATASSRMNGQAGAMIGFVDRLVKLIEGGSAENEGSEAGELGLTQVRQAIKESTRSLPGVKRPAIVHKEKPKRKQLTGKSERAIPADF